MAAVKSRKIADPGNRSESAFYSLAVREVLLSGPAGPPVSAGRYTRCRRHYLAVGRDYLLMLGPNRAPGGKAHVLMKFELYSVDRADALLSWMRKTNT